LSWRRTAIRTLDDYISARPVKLFKLHGSVDWARAVDVSLDSFPNRAAVGIMEQLISHAREVRVTDRFFRFDQIAPVVDGDVVLFPALAIPTTTKSDFECPSDHIKALKHALCHVDRVLTVGWRAAETHFLAILKDCLPGPIPLQIVTGSEEDSRAVENAFTAAGVRLASTDSHSLGFSRFIQRRGVLWLLSGNP